MKWTVGRKIGFAFGVFTLLLLLVSVVSYRQAKEAEQELKVLKEEKRESDLLFELSRHLVLLERATRRAVASGSPADTRPATELGRAQSVLKSLREFTSQTPGPEDEHEAREALLLGTMKASLDRIGVAVAEGSSAITETARTQASNTVIEECSRLTGTVRRFRTEDAPVTREALKRSKGATRRSTQVVFYVALASMLIAVATGFYFVRLIGRPIQKLREGASRVGRGEFEHKIKVETSDEIGDLADEFNRMSDQLKSSYQNLEQQVSDKTRQLLHSSRLAGIGTLAAGIAHEINNPLASVASCAEGLLKRADEPSLREIEAFRDFREYLEIIREEAYRCKKITRSLLDFSRKQEPVIEPVSVSERLRAVVALLQRKANDEGKVLALDLPAQDVTLQADPGQLSQLFFNLISNGLEAIGRGGRVSLAVESDEAELRVTVRDDGAGIAPEAMDRIWEPFYTTKPPGEGTGLGLALCYSIVRNHDGWIKCRSDGLYRGAAFEVMLPRKRSTEEGL